MHEAVSLLLNADDDVVDVESSEGMKLMGVRCIDDIIYAGAWPPF